MLTDKETVQEDWLVECILCGHRYRIDRIMAMSSV